jgi:hypothetical protein
MLAGLTQSLELFAAPTLAGLFIIGFAAHFLAKSASLTKFAEAADRLLNRLTRTHP